MSLSTKFQVDTVLWHNSVYPLLMKNVFLKRLIFFQEGATKVTFQGSSNKTKPNKLLASKISNALLKKCSFQLSINSVNLKTSFFMDLPLTKYV